MGGTMALLDRTKEQDKERKEEKQPELEKKLEEQEEKEEEQETKEKREKAKAGSKLKSKSEPEPKPKPTPEQIKKEQKKQIYKTKFQKYNKENLIMKFIFKAATVPRKETKEETDGFEVFEKTTEHISSAKDIVDSVGDFAGGMADEKASGNDVKDYIKKHPKGILGWLKGEGDKGEEGKSIYGQVMSFIQPVIDTITFVKDIMTYFKNKDAMSDVDKQNKIANLVSKAIGLATGATKTVMSFFKEIPILGGIVDGIEHAVTIFKLGYNFVMQNKRLKRLRESRRELKDKMAAKREKYKGEEKAGEDLFDFMETKEKKATVDRKKLNNEKNSAIFRKYNKEAGGIDASEVMKITREDRKGENKVLRREYYRAKAADMMNQFKTIDEERNQLKNQWKVTVIECVTEGIKLLGFIADFFPGVGKLISGGASIAATGFSKGYEWVAKAANKLRKDHNAEKEVRRKTIASSIFWRANATGNELMEGQAVAGVENFNPDELVDKKTESVGMLLKNIESIDRDLNVTAASIPNLLEADSQQKMIEQLSGIFAAGG